MVYLSQLAAAKASTIIVLCIATVHCMYVTRHKKWSVPLRLRIHRMSKFLRMESPLRSRLSGMDCKASLAKSRSIYSDRDTKTNQVVMKQNKLVLINNLPCSAQLDLVVVDTDKNMHNRTS